MRHPLLPLLLLLVAALAVGDSFFPYGIFRRAPEWGESEQTRVGVVTRQPVRYGQTTRATVRLLDGAGSGVVELTLGSDSSGQGAEGGKSTVHPGDEIAFHARIVEPRNAGNPGERDYAAYLRHQGITGTAYAPARHWHNLGATPRPRLTERMLRLREHLVEAYARHFEGETLAILAAMTLGDRSLVDRHLRDLYSQTGSSHVLALSGMHLSVLAGLLTLTLWPLVRIYGRRGRRIAAAVTVAVVWTFVLLAGLPVSLVRAAMMLTLVAFFMQREHNVRLYHSLTLALILMLLADPSLLFDVGLQLSAVSVAAILGLGYVRRLMTPHYATLIAPQLRLYAWRSRWQQSGVVRRCPKAVLSLVRWALAMVAVSLVAQLATLPLVVHYFGRFSPVGTLASLVAVPAATVLLVGAWAFLLLVPLRGLIAAVLTPVVHGLHAVLGALSHLPGATVPLQLSAVGVAMCYLIMGLVGWRLALWLVPALRTANRLSRRLYRIPTLVLATSGVTLLCASETTLAFLHRPTTQLAAYNRWSRMELHLTTATSDSVITTLADDGRHVAGRVVVFAGHRLAVADRWMPLRSHSGRSRGDKTAMSDGAHAQPSPLPVDALLVARGMKGSLAAYLTYYRPAVVVLDGSLYDAARRRYAEEAAAAHLPVYDIRERGAFILTAGAQHP